MWALAAFLLFAQADYTTEGMKALDEGKYDSAVQAFRKAIDADSKDYFAHFNLAMAYTLLQRDPEAVAEYRKTLELKPGLYEAELNGGIVLLRQKNPSKPCPCSRMPPARSRRSFARAITWPNRNSRPATTPMRKRVTNLPSRSMPNPPERNSAWRRRWCRKDASATPTPYFHQAAKLEPKYRDYLLELAALYEKASQNSRSHRNLQGVPG